MAAVMFNKKDFFLNPAYTYKCMYFYVYCPNGRIHKWDGQVEGDKYKWRRFFFCSCCCCWMLNAQCSKCSMLLCAVRCPIHARCVLTLVRRRPMIFRQNRIYNSLSVPICPLSSPCRFHVSFFDLYNIFSAEHTPSILTEFHKFLMQILCWKPFQLLTRWWVK